MNDPPHYFDVAIIGAGVVGSAVAHELSRYRIRVALIEKEHDVAEGISKANSGVLHAGFMVPPGSLKARLNIAGRNAIDKLAASLGVPVTNCRKLIVGKGRSDLPYLKILFENGEKNGCRGLELLTGDQISAVERNVNGAHALYSNNTSVLLPYLLTTALAENAMLNGVTVFLQSPVERIERLAAGYIVRMNHSRAITARMVVNAAGLSSDRIARLVDPHFDEEVYAWRGEYQLLEQASTNVVRTAVYPVPPRGGAGLGVHITPTVNGGILLGPSAHYISHREDTGNTASVLAELKDAAGHLVPGLRGLKTIKTYSGIRPKLFGPGQGVTFRDFHIAESHRSPGFYNLVGIESPGLTAAPAIAEMVRDDFVSRYVELVPKTDWAFKWEPIPRTRYLEAKELNLLWKKNPSYGKTVCYCESVSEAEIRRAVDNPLGAISLHAIRKRTHATLGECQGAYCIGRIQALLKRTVSKAGIGTDICLELEEKSDDGD